MLESPDDLANGVSNALEQYVAKGGTSDVNEYLDALGMEHPHLTHRRQVSGSVIEPEAIPASTCGPYDHPACKWVPDRWAGTSFGIASLTANAASGNLRPGRV
jgi:hypothetical protein